MTREVQFADVQDPPAIRMHDFPIVARIEEQVGNSFQKAWQRFDISATEVAKSQGSHAARVGEMVADLTKVLVNSAKASPPAKPSSEEIAIRLLRAGVSARAGRARNLSRTSNRPRRTSGSPGTATSP